METLYIIGNGFDIYHGIRSRYADFKQYLLTHDRSLHNLIEEYIPVEEIWSDLEAALAQIDVDNVVDYASQVLASYGAEDWSDAGHHDYQYEVDRIIEGLSSDLISRFSEWIRQLEIPFLNDLSVRPLDILPDARFLTFNYTPSLSDIYDIPSTSILFIHGEAIKEQDLVLGHAWNPVEIPSLNDVSDPESMDTRVMEGNEMINRYFKRTFKDTKKVIEENNIFFESLTSLSRIYILGHSLSEVDVDYFKEIARNVNLDMVEWVVTYYEDKEREHHKNALKSIGIPEKEISLCRIDEL